MDEENLEEYATSWLYREKNDEPVNIPKKKYLKEYPIVDKMGYQGQGLWPKEQGKIEPIAPISYKYNRGLGYFIEPKLTLASAPQAPAFDVYKSNEEKLYEMPFEYLDDLFLKTHICTITPSIPSRLPLVYPNW